MKQGMYCTPFLNYVSLPKSVPVGNNHTMSQSNVREWCKYSNKYITKHSVSNNPLLTEKDLGRELDFT